MSFIERWTAARDAYVTARDALHAEMEERIKAEYARLRAEDKAAGRDTSGKSVQNRRVLAFDRVNMSDDIRARREAVEQLYQAYKAAGNPA